MEIGAVRGWEGDYGMDGILVCWDTVVAERVWIGVGRGWGVEG